MDRSQDPAAAALPEHIGPYRVERRLGRGGMGEVFLAWDEGLERRVAVKRIRHDAEASPRQRERFRREARSAARLSHPSVVQVHHLVSDGIGDAIVLEYVEGVSIAEKLAAGPLPPQDAVSLARQIAEGLVAAHDAGLIHRDLKAENVLVTPSGQAKILDFGLVRPLLAEPGEVDLTQYGALVGTCHAMSPEQASGGTVDARSDLFSFGALLYELLTGRAPFRGADAVESLQRVLNETPPPLRQARPDLPDQLAEFTALADLVERLLAKDCRQRPRDAREVVLILARIEIRGQARDAPESVSDMSTGPALVASPSAVRALRAAAAASPAPRRAPRWLQATVILLLLALAAALAVLLARRGPLPLFQPLRIAIERPVGRGGVAGEGDRGGGH